MSANNVFTIHTELLEGDLSGARKIYMGANSTCHLYVIPRVSINLANSIDDIAGQPSFYILLGDMNTYKPEAYIGQTTDFANRKNDHMQKKDFWKTALVFISNNHMIYGDDVKYLEYLGIDAALRADSHLLHNGANPRKPNIAPYRVNDMNSFFRDIQLLTRFYGCGIFDAPVAKPEPRHLFYVKSQIRKAFGTGYYDESNKKFVLMKDSILASDCVKCFKAVAAREAFIEELCKKENGQYILQFDAAMDSPSRASNFILGSSTDGWEVWKDAEGKKLGEVVKREI